MTLVNLKGLAKATKVLADGTKRTYFYAWRGGPMLQAEDGSPLLRGDPSFHIAFADAHRDRRPASVLTLASLISSYRASSDFKGRADKTRKAYSHYLDLIEVRFGTMPLPVVTDARTRGDFKSWRDTMAATPRAADYAWTTLARVLSFAKDRGKITVNVCERGGRLYTADRAEKIWEASHIKAFGESAPAALRLALMLALWTGQREGDLLRAPWSAYDGKSIKIRQGKTGARVVIPVGEPLRVQLELAKASKNTTTILENTRGRSWTEDGFRASWGKATTKAGIIDRRFHDLRGTAVTRLALAECTVTQIASITGHSLNDVQAILDAHYLGGRFELAEAAIQKMELHEGRTKTAN